MTIWSSLSFPYGPLLDCARGSTEATQEEREKKKLGKKDNYIEDGSWKNA